MRSTLLYFRKHSGVKSSLICWLEVLWYRARAIKNKLRSDAASARKARELYRLAALMQMAWRETRGGRISPPQPW
jgi:hypothetical protein